MFKYKKIIINLVTIIYVLLTTIELIKYLICDNTLFGMYYMIICLLTIFLLVPCAYNYKKYYSPARISKLIIIVLLIVFNSFIIEHLLFSAMGYIDSSKTYIDNIFIIKNILKPIISFILVIFIALEFKLDEVIKKSISNKRA